MKRLATVVLLVAALCTSSRRLPAAAQALATSLVEATGPVTRISSAWAVRELPVPEPGPMPVQDLPCAQDFSIVPRPPFSVITQSSLCSGGGRNPSLEYRFDGRSITCDQVMSYYRSSLPNLGWTSILAAEDQDGYTIELENPDSMWSITNKGRVHIVCGRSEVQIRLDKNANAAFASEWGALLVPRHPSTLTTAHVNRYEAVQHRVACGESSRAEAERDLAQLTAEVGRAGFAWLVRWLPVYNTSRQQWSSIDSHLQYVMEKPGIGPESRLGQDPLGTAVDLMFGEPSSEQVRGWLDMDY